MTFENLGPNGPPVDEPLRISCDFGCASETYPNPIPRSYVSKNVRFYQHGLRVGHVCDACAQVRRLVEIDEQIAVDIEIPQDVLGLPVDMPTNVFTCCGCGHQETARTTDETKSLRVYIHEHIVRCVCSVCAGKYTPKQIDGFPFR